MPTIDYFVILIFSLLIVAAGVSFSKRGSDMKSYFAAGGSVPWSINGLSLYMSFFSAGTFVVWGSIAYQMGWVAISIQMTMCIGGFLVAFYTYIILFLSLAYTGAFLYPVAKIVNVSTGWPITTCVIGLGALILIYTIIGGLWAVIITDVLQFVILSIAIILVVYLSLQEVGGFQNFVAKVPDNFWNLTGGEYSWWFIAAFALYNLVFIGGNWAYVQRYTSVETEKDAKKVGLTFGFLYLISPLIWMLPPMVYKVINPNLGGLETEGAYMMICKLVLPGGMLGLMLGGMVFATASSVNTTLNLAASVITNDIFLLLRPNASDKQIMNTAKIATLVFGIGTIGVALLVPYVGGIVNVVLSVGAVTGCSLYGPPIWALFSKRQTGKSILQVTVLSLIVNIFLKMTFELSRANEMLFGTLFPFLLLAIYEAYFYIKKQNESPDYLKYQQLKTIAVPERSEKSQNTFAMKVLANTLIAIGLLLVGLGINSESSKLAIAVLGAMVIVIALFIHPVVKLKLND